MKRFHVHVHVDDLPASIAFYSALFAAPPSRLEADYAKWMLEDPRVNFAISTRGGGRPGVDHLGLQADSEEELAELKGRARAADLALLDEGEARCCYAHSDKYWLTDPQGIAWEQYRTLGDIPVFGEGAAPAPTAAPALSAAAAGPAVAAAAAACCAPAAPRGRPVGLPVKSASGCC
ncbi:ArsI/CadI family heavy metal resistance metalloenzyme [Piscinibacter sakaiensis]|uniref:Lactoylglutathione lyase n=1 Tax=Piscinibacter sakaiensis TaxID=1547922 RepID=A0A0K8NU63_PISS1|nr:ArsI/CadI family heavy metal resistance metalloenzyme [Piscinibacter sakaiensis]GAP33927.1 lactoylglutathione lyase [Piscinibacter sakaiensis]